MLRHGSLGLVGVVVQGGVRFLTNVLVGRFGGPSVLAAVAGAISAALLFSLLGPTSLGSAAAKFVARSSARGDDVESRVVAAFLARRAVGVAAGLAAAGSLLSLANEQSSWGEWACVGVLVLGYSGYNFSRGFQFGAGRISNATAWDVGTALLGLAGVTTVLAVGFRGIVVMLPIALSYVLFSAANWPRGMRGSPIAQLRREIDGFVLLGTIGTLAGAGFLQLSMLVARLADSTVAAGNYAAAMTLATPVSLVSAATSLVLFPSLARLWGAREERAFQATVIRATRFLIALVVPAVGLLVLNSGPVVSLLWGAQFAGTSVLLPILMIAVMANILVVPSVNSLTSTSQRGMKASTLSTLGGMVVGLVSWTALCPPLGVTGVAIGYLCGSITVAALSVFVAGRRWSLKWVGLWVRAVAGTVLLVVLLVVEHLVSPNWPAAPLASLVFLCLWLLVSGPDLRVAARRVALRTKTKRANNLPAA